jgi:hypothetical protein
MLSGDKKTFGALDLNEIVLRKIKIKIIISI